MREHYKMMNGMDLEKDPCFDLVLYYTTLEGLNLVV